MCVFSYTFSKVFFFNFKPLVPPETTCIISIYVCGLKILVHTDWHLCILLNRNGYGNLSFVTLLTEDVARLIDVRTLQFPSVGDVLSLVIKS